MKTLLAMAAFLFAGATAAANAQTSDAQLVAKAPRPIAPVCKKSLQLPGADGSTAMAELPATTLLYNDRHVTGADPVVMSLRALGGLRCYSDLDSSGYLIGLRNAFEAMGGTVSFSANGKMIAVEKPGVSIKLQIGKPSISLNGETRPLDVPPIIYRGVIYVPIRVISEGLGGYVVWDGAARTVVIRYLPASSTTPPPTPTPASPTPDDEPTAIPTAAPPSPIPSPVTTAKPRTFTRYIAGDYDFASKTFDAFDDGNSGGASFSARAAFEFPLGSVPFMVGGDFRSFAYPHDAAALAGASGSSVPTYIACPANGFPGCVSTPGRTASVYVPARDLRDTTVAANVGIGLGAHTFVAGSYAAQSNDYPSSYPSIPTLTGLGFGIDRLPDLDQLLSFYASGYYYPTLGGTYGYPAGLPPPTADTSGKLQESLFKYSLGLTARIAASPLFLDLGFVGDSIRGKNLAPGDASHVGGYVGVGVKF